MIPAGSPASPTGLRELFEAVVDAPTPLARSELLARLCPADPALRAEVEELLVHHDAGADTFDRPAADFTSAAPAEPPEPLLSPGLRIGRFTILRPIGSGGMGDVYEAEQDKPRRRVALKALRLGLLSAGARRRFRQEAAVLARLDHPGIARVIVAGVIEAGGDGDEEDPRPYLVMEFIDGPSITAFSAQRELGALETLDLLAQVCDAVQHAHDRGIIHRDIKPSNVLVDAAGRAKLLDFGIARVTDADIRATSSLTESGQILGSLPYMSPEQASGRAAEVDERSDVYALGALAYEALSGRPPVETEGLAPIEVVHAVCERLPRRLGAVRRELRGDVDAVIMKALEKEPAFRYASAAEMAHHLRLVARGERTPIRPPSAARQLHLFVARNRQFSLGVGVAAAALVFGAAGTSWMALRAMHAEEDARAHARELRSLSGELLFDLYDVIRRVPGSTTARHAIVERSVSTLDRLAARTGDDPELQRDLAEAYMRIGAVVGDGLNPNLGDVATAATHYAKASVYLRRLVVLYPGDRQLHRDLAHCLRKATMWRPSREGYADVDRQFDEPIKILSRLLEDDPADLETLLELAPLLRDSALEYTNFGISVAGAERFEGYEDVVRRLVSLAPQERRVRLEAAHADMWCAYLIRNEPERRPQAIELLHSALRMFDTALEQDPADDEPRKWAVNVRVMLATTHAHLFERDEALRRLEEALSLATTDHLADPDDAAAYRLVLVAQWSSGDCWAILGDSNHAPRDERLAMWTEALRWYTVAERTVLKRKARGWLPPNEERYPSQVRAQIEAAKARISELSP